MKWLKFFKSLIKEEKRELTVEELFPSRRLSDIKRDDPEIERLFGRVAAAESAIGNLIKALHIGGALIDNDEFSKDQIGSITTLFQISKEAMILAQGLKERLRQVEFTVDGIMAALPDKAYAKVSEQRGVCSTRTVDRPELQWMAGRKLEKMSVGQSEKPTKEDSFHEGELKQMKKLVVGQAEKDRRNARRRELRKAKMLGMSAETENSRPASKVNRAH